MSYNKYLAECLGAFALTFVVLLSVAFPMPLSALIMAPLTLGLFVAMIGGISGAHLNPAISIALLTANKMKAKDSAFYVIAQLIGAAIALFVGSFLGEMTSMSYDSSLPTGIAEALGAFFLAFGVSTVGIKKMSGVGAGVVVGGSLLLGIYVASAFSNGILNPAVALGVGSFGSMYILGPIVGAIVGVWTSMFLLGEKS